MTYCDITFNKVKETCRILRGAGWGRLEDEFDENGKRTGSSCFDDT